MDYKTSGVDIEAGDAFVEQIKETVKSTHRPEVMGGFGGFNGMVRIPKGYERPVLVSGADGVGTKTHVYEMTCSGDKEFNIRGAGIDLVAMCVNDVITCGAKPLYFLDYICTSDLERNKKLLKQLVYGIADGCKQSGCSLLGGETAEHPRRLASRPIIIDLSGFCTGVVEECEIIDGELIRESDVVIGIESSGLHSNGYSLIRDMLFRHKISLGDSYIGEGTPELVIPTTIYASVVSDLVEEFPILGMAHITGGGIPGNLPRCIPEGLKVDVDYNAWPMPKLFSKIMLAGEIPEEEMKKTFNMGIGYCVVVPANVAEDVRSKIQEHDMKSWIIGEVTHI